MTKRSANNEQQEQPRWRRQAASILETQIARSPFLLQSRAVLRQLRHERESWPFLIPLLLFVFVTVYRRERQKLRAVAEELEDDE
jgi:hypothetical protein